MPRKKACDLPPIDQMKTLREYSDDEVEKSVADGRQWSTDLVTTEDLSKKLKKSPSKRKMTPAQLKNLRQFSGAPHTDEAKKRSLANLRTPDTRVTKVNVDGEQYVAPVDDDCEVIIPSCLDADSIRDSMSKRELVYFVSRWNSYMLEHEQDFNTAEDADDLRELLQCYVQQMRMEKKKNTNPAFNYRVDFDKIAQNLSIRIQTIKTSLGTRRKDRIENNERKQSAFVGLIVGMAKEKSSIADALEQKMIQHIEEDLFIKRKLEKAIEVK